MLTLAYHPGDFQILNSTHCQKMCKPNPHLFDRGLPDLSVRGDVDHHGKTTRKVSFRLYSPRPVPYKSRRIYMFVPPSRCFSSGQFYLVRPYTLLAQKNGWLSCLGDQMYGMTITVSAVYGKPPIFVRRALGETPVIQLVKDKKTLSWTV
jgi:hypothetical protein